MYNSSTNIQKTNWYRNKFTDAAFNGDLATIKELIDNGEDVNQKDNSSQTALSWAAGEGHLDVVKFLLKNGGDINTKDKKDYNALDWACINKKHEMVKYLLNHGAQIGGKRTSTLIMMIMRGEEHFEIFKILLEYIHATKNYSILSKSDSVSKRTPLLWILRKHPYAPVKKYSNYKSKETFYKFFYILIKYFYPYLNLKAKDKYGKDIYYWLKKHKENECLDHLKNIQQQINIA